MNTKRNIIIGAVIVVVLLIIGFYAMYKKNPIEETYIPTDDQTAEQGYVVPLNVKHQYKDGKHTYAGTIDLPTPCHSVTTKANKDATDAKKFTIDFTTKTTGDVCAQVITTRGFKVSFEGPRDAMVSARLDGKEIRLNVFEVGANEDLDNFNIDIKG